MKAFLYRLKDFSNEDEGNDTHLMETKIDVIPMISGFFYIGVNYINVYLYKYNNVLAKPVTIFQDEETIVSSENYSLIIPYQDKRLAQKIAARNLEAKGYINAAEAVQHNPVTQLKRGPVLFTSYDIREAKRWDKKIDENFYAFLNDTYDMLGIGDE